MVYMDVRGRNHFPVVIVLHIRQVILEVPLVVVIDQREHSDRGRVYVCFIVFQKTGADQLAKGLGAVGNTVSFDDFIES